MALIIPTSTSFADSSPSEGHRLDKKYILAQFRGDADFSWVARLRSFLAVTELKYRVFRERRHRVKNDRDLWKKVESGIGQATIIVIDPEPTIRAIRNSAESQGMTEADGLTDKWLARSCATTLIKNTPVAYLPSRLAEATDWSSYHLFGSMQDFLPNNILQAIGGDLRHAKVFAARAHAMFDLHNFEPEASTTRDVFTSPLSRVLLTEVLATSRQFDVELPKTIDILNQAAKKISEAIVPQRDNLNSSTGIGLISEHTSENVDELQAADMAAGWARETYDLTGDPRTLAPQFERVWINGTRVK